MEITKTTIKIEITHDWLCRQNSSLFFLQIHQICCVTIFVTNEVRLNVATFCSRDFDFIFDNFMKSACYVQKAFLKSFISTRKHLLGHQMHLLCHKIFYLVQLPMKFVFALQKSWSTNQTIEMNNSARFNQANHTQKLKIVVWKNREPVLSWDLLI